MSVKIPGQFSVTINTSGASEMRQAASIGVAASRIGKDCRGPMLLDWKNTSKMRSALFGAGEVSKDAPMGQRQI